MFGSHLEKHYENLRALGLVRSSRHFSRTWLGRSPHYLRNIGPRDRGWRPLSSATTARLRERLEAVAAQVPVGVAAEIKAVIDELDHDTHIAATMTGWRT